MSGEIESTSIIGWFLGVMAIPLGWIMLRVQTLSGKVDNTMSKDEIKDYINLKLEPMDVKIDHINKSLEEHKSILLRIDKSVCNREE